MQKLISPQEAIRLFDYATYDDMRAAHDVAYAYQHRPEGYNPNSCNDAAFLLTCVWNAGRVQGIRAERFRNKQRIAKREMSGCKPMGVTRTTDGRTIPIYQMGGFINTREGWNLFVKCSNNAHDAMEPYREAQAAWEAAQ